MYRTVGNNLLRYKDPTGLIRAGSHHPVDHHGGGPTSPTSIIRQIEVEYSRGGDDRPRDYQTARIFISLIVNRESNDENGCPVYSVRLRYRAHLTGAFTAMNNFRFNLVYGDGVIPLVFTPSQGVPGDWGNLNAEIWLETYISGSVGGGGASCCNAWASGP